MAAGNRLSRERLAALEPGDEVIIESAADGGRPRLSTGRVVRIDSAHIVVSCCSPRGVRYVQRYGRRDGVMVGSGRPAALVDAEVAGSSTRDQRRRALRIEALYREWTRDRANVDKLRRLHAAIEESLADSLV